MLGEYKLNEIYNEDCYEAIKKIPDKSVDCIYVDGNNHSVTLNSPYLCLKCYLKRYGDK